MARLSFLTDVFLFVLLGARHATWLWNGTNRYVFGESPHGVYPIGPVLAGTVVPLCFPGMKVQAVSASNVFKVRDHSPLFTTACGHNSRSHYSGLSWTDSRGKTKQTKQPQQICFIFNISPLLPYLLDHIGPWAEALYVVAWGSTSNQEKL